ncbi:MAG: glycosyltransferase family 4 protein [Polaromonas sp.]|uniref:glycosyltransferase family 4 protein n=1 Tax=Polaromonas sp. TaxID=1869339 RepID=UPI0017B9AF2D|nr:glycosyltransferase family 4 protein [Polaromonas sp.]NMM11434.1 glycosyltransferase family 4 protein [Polaromonas sp.]
MNNKFKTIRMHFVGSVVPAGDESSSDAISHAGNLCQLGLIRGFTDTVVELIQVISYFPNRIFPVGKRVYFSGKHRTLPGDIDFYAIPYLNLPGLRAITVNAGVLLNLLVNARRGDVVLFYNVTIPSGLLGLLLRLIRGVHCFAMVYDIHVPGQTVPDSWRWRFEYWKHKWLLPRLDGVIAITSKILFDFNATNNGIVVEGGVAVLPSAIIFSSLARSPSTFTMVYAGRLNEDNGIELMLRAMARLTNAELRMVIVGSGLLSDTVKKAAEKDARITYLGVISHSEVTALYRGAQLLMCIRITKQLNTGYFFPSKLIECLATGVPVLTTRVTGGSFDPAEYAYVVDDETDQGVAAGILESMKNGAAYNFAKGEKARLFISENMTWSKQCLKISHFLLTKIEIE